MLIDNEYYYDECTSGYNNYDFKNKSDDNFLRENSLEYYSPHTPLDYFSEYIPECHVMTLPQTIKNLKTARCSEINADLSKVPSQQNPQVNVSQVVTSSQNSDAKFSDNIGNIIDYNYDTMCAQASILGVPCTVLFDTGSDLTIVSKHFLDSLQIKDNICPPTFVEATSVNQTPIRLEGQHTLPINFKGCEFQIEAHIIANSAHDIILGRDYMNQIVDKIDFANFRIKFKGCRKMNIECNVLSDKNTHEIGLLTRDISVPSNSSIQAYIRGKNVPRMGTANIQSIHSLCSKYKLICENGSNISQGTDGFPCTLYNYSGKQIDIPKGTEIAKLTYRNTTPKLLGTCFSVQNFESQKPIENSSLTESITFEVGEKVLLRDKMNKKGKQ